MPSISQNQRHLGCLGVLVALTALASACGPSYPKCDDDDDCKEKEFCVNGMCQQCRGDQDCKAGQECASGRCQDIADYCTSDADCEPGQSCLGNRCQSSLGDTSSGDDDGKKACTIDAVYFAFDSSELPADARTKVESNVRCMQQKGIAGVHLTGHADPRGTEEYNLALGDRRAQSVKKLLGAMGLSGSKVTASSMGEEMADGTDESSWAQDRRVDFTPK